MSLVTENTKIRAPNFTNTEKLLVLEMVKKYRHIIECKKTDKVATNKKNECWESLSGDFHAPSLGSLRTASQLRSLYDQMKKNAKKEKSADKIATFLTGGGKKNSEISDVSIKTLEVMEPLTTTPLENRFDSSAKYNNDKMLYDEATFVSDAVSHNDDEQSQECLETFEIEYLDDNEQPSTSSAQLNSSNISSKSTNINNQRQRPAVRGIYEELAGICGAKTKKLYQSRQFEEELMKMRRYRHEMEMKVLNEQHQLLLQWKNNSNKLLEMRQDQHIVELNILKEQLNRLENV